MYYSTSQLGVGLVLGSDNSLYVAGDFMLTLIKYTQSGAGQPPVVSDILNQTVVAGGRFAAIRVDNYVADPDSSITWSWSGNTSLRVTWDPVRRRVVVRPLRGWTGSETITFTATDPDGLSDSDQATFTVTSSGSTNVLERTTSEREIPSETFVEGNYPNPFNPGTTIRYALEVDSWVTLRVFSAIGEEVKTLVDQLQSAGYHSVVWNGMDRLGRQASSGVYIYTLRAGNYTDSGKMILSK